MYVCLIPLCSLPPHTRGLHGRPVWRPTCLRRDPYLFAQRPQCTPTRPPHTPTVVPSLPDPCMPTQPLSLPKPHGPSCLFVRNTWVKYIAHILPSGHVCAAPCTTHRPGDGIEGPALVHKYTHRHMHECKVANAHADMHAGIHTYRHTAYTHTAIHMRTHTYIHTYIHTLYRQAYHLHTDTRIHTYTQAANTS